MARITISAITGPVTVMVGGMSLGGSRKALELKEDGYQPVLYLPREDIDMSRLVRTERVTTCPWKGQASYYSIRTDGEVLENAVWTYEDPLPEVARIARHLAFYPARVTVRRG